MSPSYYHQNRLTVFTDNAVYASIISPSEKRETKKEKTKRVAEEKMFASWKVYNQKTESIIEIKQICKPRHKIYKK